MIVHPTQTQSYGTDPTAAAVQAALRPATFQPARRAPEQSPSAGRAGTFDVDTLYPNLSTATERPSIVLAATRQIAAAFASLRHVIASL